MSLKKCLLDTAHAVRDGTIKMDSLYFTDQQIDAMERELKKSVRLVNQVERTKKGSRPLNGRKPNH